MVSATNVAVYNRRAAIRGDTLLGWSFSVSIDEVPVDIVSARSQLRTKLGGLIHNYELTVDGNQVTIPDVSHELTQAWPTGILEFDVEVTLASGRVVTWITGTQPIFLDRTY